MAWLEIHQSVLTHRKTFGTSVALGIAPLYAASHLIALWLWALDNAEDGILPNSAILVAHGAQWLGDPQTFLDTLLHVGWLDVLPPDGQHVAIHDWETYAGKLLDRRKANRNRMRAARGSKLTLIEGGQDDRTTDNGHNTENRIRTELGTNSGTNRTEYIRPSIRTNPAQPTHGEGPVQRTNSAQYTARAGPQYRTVQNSTEPDGSINRNSATSREIPAGPVSHSDLQGPPPPGEQGPANGLPGPAALPGFQPGAEVMQPVTVKTFDDYAAKDPVFYQWFGKLWEIAPVRIDRTTGKASKGSKVAAARKAHHLSITDRALLWKATLNYARLCEYPKDFENFISDGRTTGQLWREYVNPEEVHAPAGANGGNGHGKRQGTHRANGDDNRGGSTRLEIEAGPRPANKIEQLRAKRSSSPERPGDD